MCAWLIPFSSSGLGMKQILHTDSSKQNPYLSGGKINTMCSCILFLPNFSDLIWKAVLSFYIGDYTLPLPTSEEVLVCTTATTAEEVCD